MNGHTTENRAGRKASFGLTRFDAARNIVAPRISEHEAVASARQSIGSLVARVVKGRRSVRSVELAYLPWWWYDYTIELDRPRAATCEPTLCGTLAVETRSTTGARVSTSLRFVAADDSAKLLPVGREPDADVARRMVLFEAMGRIRRRRVIGVRLEPARLIYLPYWVVYVSGGDLHEALPVDACKGVVDLALQDSLLAALIEARRGLRYRTVPL